MTFSMKEPAAGDIIRVDCENGILHYGIYVSDDEVIQFGLPPFRGIPQGDDVTVLVSNIDAFLEGRFLQVGELDRAERKKARTPDEIVRFARSKLGTGGYDIVHNNCEHFAQECVFGVKKSDCVENLRKTWQARFERDKKSR